MTMIPQVMYQVSRVMYNAHFIRLTVLSLALNINPVMEGEKGRERLELQRTFGGDDRFKLGADFMDEDSEEEESWNQTKQGDNLAQDEIAAELNQEKSTSLDVLKAMFGEDNRTALR